MYNKNIYPRQLHLLRSLREWLILSQRPTPSPHSRALTCPNLTTLRSHSCHVSLKILPPWEDHHPLMDELCSKHIENESTYCCWIIAGLVQGWAAWSYPSHINATPAHWWSPPISLELRPEKQLNTLSLNWLASGIPVQRLNLWRASHGQAWSVWTSENQQHFLILEHSTARPPQSLSWTPPIL